MTYCAFDSLEISTCVRVPFYVTPPHSQPFNMMHICTSTATNPPPRSTPTSAKHTNRHTRRQMRALGSTHARVLSHRHTRRHHRFVCAYWGCSLHAGKHTCGHIYTHGALTDDLFLLLFFNSFIQTYSYIDLRFMCLKKTKNFPLVCNKTRAYALPSSSYITHHANERECHSSAADGQGW